MAKATLTGVNMDVAQRRKGGIKILSEIGLRDYVDAKYEGLPEDLRRVILHPYYQFSMQHGNRGAMHGA